MTEGWSVYILETGEQKLYTGISTDVERRLQEHRDGGPKAAKSLKGKGPLQLLFSAEVGSRSEALKLEAAIKKLSREKKQALIEQGCLDTMLA